MTSYRFTRIPVQKKETRKKKGKVLLCKSYWQPFWLAPCYSASQHAAASCSNTTDISCFHDSFFLLPEQVASALKSQNLYRLFKELGFAPKIRSAANLSTILDLVAQNEGVYLTHAWCRACKSLDYQVLPLPASQIFYLGCHKTNRSPETAELFIQLATWKGDIEDRLSKNPWRKVNFGL